jgi:hypothetical protein
VQIKAGLHGCRHIPFGGIAGYGNRQHASAGLQAAYFPDQLIAVLVGHTDVGDQNIEMRAGGL